jgi:hypothetical protein
VKKKTLKFQVYAGLYVTKLVQQLPYKQKRLKIHSVLHMIVLSRTEYQKTLLQTHILASVQIHITISVLLV